ncbi:MAG: hypothetical protein FWD12_06030 [Alphaproteobacteria bacterium]|nr:hypothetical protein [Alphaproteobacteria bacterium]
MQFDWHYSIHLPQGYAAVRLAQGRAVRERRRQLRGALRARRHRDRGVYEAAEYGDLQHLFFTALDDVRALFVAARMQTQN